MRIYLPPIRDLLTVLYVTPILFTMTLVSMEILVPNADTTEKLHISLTFAPIVGATLSMTLILALVYAQCVVLNMLDSYVMSKVPSVLRILKTMGRIVGSFTLVKRLNNGVVLSLLYLKSCLLTLKRRIRARWRKNQTTGEPLIVKKSTPFVDPFQFYQSKQNSEDWSGLNCNQTIVNDSKQKQEESWTTSESSERSGDQSDSDSQETELPFHRQTSSITFANFTLKPNGRFYKHDTPPNVTGGRNATKDVDAATQ